MRRHRILLGTLVAAGLCAGPAFGQGIYRGTDDRGGVHFGNSPLTARDAVMQKLPPKRIKPAVVEDAAGDERSEDGTADSGDSDVTPESSAHDAPPSDG